MLLLSSLLLFTLHAVSQHIKVLASAGVVTRLRVGQTRPVRLRPASLGDTGDWIAARTRQLENRYQRLDDLVAELQGDRGRPTLESLTFVDLGSDRCRIEGLSLYTSAGQCIEMLAFDESGEGMDENFERLDALLATLRQ